MAKPLLQGRTDLVIVTYGDMPLLRSTTLARLAQTQSQSKGVLTMLTVKGDPASSFGRVVRDEEGQVLEIVEVAEAGQRPNTDALLAITELNAGVYCFDSAWLWANITDLPLRQARRGQEYYLTDMVSMAAAQGRPVQAEIVADEDECLGAGTRQELVAVERAFRRRANTHWLNNGVTLLDPNSVYIDQDVFIGQDTIIWPNTYIQGNSRIGEACIIGPNSIIRNAQIGSNCWIEAALVENASLQDGTNLAPFTVIRNNTEAYG
jgi:bifunctional UDP-N-acetylglucosamine pyrophosphorylase/glucosamine-1-phosphate N-acetyltransferase